MEKSLILKEHTKQKKMQHGGHCCGKYVNNKRNVSLGRAGKACPAKKSPVNRSRSPKPSPGQPNCGAKNLKAMNLKDLQKMARKRNVPIVDAKGKNHPKSTLCRKIQDSYKK